MFNPRVSITDLKRLNSAAYDELTARPVKVFRNLHDKLHTLAKSCHLGIISAGDMRWIDVIKALVAKRFGKQYTHIYILFKGGFLLLFDSQKRRTVASLEILNSIYPMSERERTLSETKCKKPRKKKRPRWQPDPQFTDVQLPVLTGYEKGHIATYANHQAKIKTRKESCYYTNGFPQICSFDAYRDVEEWGRDEFWNCDEVAVLTWLQYDERQWPIELYKILKWKCNDDRVGHVIAVFRFPNTKNSKPHQRSSDYLTTSRVFRGLPIQLDLGNSSLIQVPVDVSDVRGKSWKTKFEHAVSAKQKNLNGRSSEDKKVKVTLIIEPKEKENHWRIGVILIWLVLVLLILALLIVVLKILDVYHLPFPNIWF